MFENKEGARFFATGEHIWAAAPSFEEVKKKIKELGGGPFLVRAFIDTVPTGYDVCPVSGRFTYFGTEEAPVTIWDSRKVADKKRSPQALGERIRYA